MDTKILYIDPLNPEEGLINEAINILARGGLVAFPTETVYGLGADAYNVGAVTNIFKVKGRPMDNPLIVHIDSLSRIDDVAIDVQEYVFDLAEKVWPGPITFILKRSPNIPREVSAGLHTIAVRCPAHSVALRLIQGLDKPIAAPSANISGKPSPTNADHVIKELRGNIDAIIDSGDTFFGVESTVVNLLSDPPILLRPGPIGVEELRDILGKDVVVPDFVRGLRDADTALSPGMKHKHYTPNTNLILVELRDYNSNDAINRLTSKVSDLVREYSSKGFKVALIASKETANIYNDNVIKLIIGSRINLYEVAKNLFKTLRAIDDTKVDIAIVEGFEEKNIGLAIMNRLRKASSKIIVINQV